jgi:hypothetical protein
VPRPVLLARGDQHGLLVAVVERALGGLHRGGVGPLGQVDQGETIFAGGARLDPSAVARGLPCRRCTMHDAGRVRQHDRSGVAAAERSEFPVGDSPLASQSAHGSRQQAEPTAPEEEDGSHQAPRERSKARLSHLCRYRYR